MKIGLNSLAWISPFSNRHLSLLQHAADMGFGAFEIDIEDENTIDCAAIRKAAQECGLEIGICGAFSEKRNMSAKDEETRAAAITYVKLLVDYAHELHSLYVAGNMYAATGDCRQRDEPEKKARFDLAADSIRTCAEYAKERGVKLAIEPLNRFETDMINTTQQAIQLLDAVGMDNVGLLLDTFHMNIEETSLPDAIRSAKGRIINFHACSNTRGTPGEDHLDWHGIKLALHDADYKGNIIIESFTEDCVEIAKAASLWRKLAPSPEALAQNGYLFLSKLFEV